MDVHGGSGRAVLVMALTPQTLWIVAPAQPSNLPRTRHWLPPASTSDFVHVSETWNVRPCFYLFLFVVIVIFMSMILVVLLRMMINLYMQFLHQVVC
jgi:hypothetical protein